MLPRERRFHVFGLGSQRNRSRQRSAEDIPPELHKRRACALSTFATGGENELSFSLASQINSPQAREEKLSTVGESLSAALTNPLARAGSIEAPRRSFTRAITRPMSFMPDAPVSATMARSRLGFLFAELLGQESLDHPDLGLFPAARSSRPFLR